MGKRCWLMEELLDEGIAEVQARFPNIPQDTFFTIIKSDPTYVDGKDSVGTYGKWLLNLFNKGNLKLEDLYKATEYLTTFDAKKKLLQNKDIGQFKSLPDLYDAIKDLGDVELNDNQKNKQFHKEIRKADLNADKVYEDDKWVVYIPNDYQASCKLSSDTQWCTGISSGGDSHYYDYYTKEGPLYIIHSKSDPDEKYQFHFESGQFMDASDRWIDLPSFLDENEGLKKFFEPIVMKPFYEELGINEETPDDTEVKYTYKYSDFYDAIGDVSGDHRDKISGEWLSKFVDDSFMAFDWYGDYNNSISDILSYNDLSQRAIDILKELGCKIETTKDFVQAYNNDDTDVIPQDKWDEIEMAFMSADSDTQLSGSVNAAERDFDYELQDTLKPLVVNGSPIGGNDVELVGTKAQWLNLITRARTEYEDGYNMGYGELNQIKKVLGTIIAEEFALYEPRYGWNDWDKDIFNDYLVDRLGEI